MSESGLTEYLKEISRFELLNPDQEIELARDVHALHLEEDKSLPEQNKKLIRKYKRSREKLINCNLRLVFFIAKKYRNCIEEGGMEFSDLIQEGTIGLAKAADKYDGKRGYRFSTYAYWWIRQAVTRGIATYGRSVKIPQNLLEKVYKISRLQKELFNVHNRYPTLKELADAIGETEERVLFIMEKGRPSISFDAKAGHNEDGFSEILNLLIDKKTLGEDYEFVEKIDEFDLLDKALEHLSKDKKLLLFKLYGLYGTPMKTLSAIAKEEDCSRENIRQKKERAIKELKGILRFKLNS